MFRRTLLRQSQAATASMRSMSTVSRAQPFLRPTTQFMKPLPPRLFQRYASTEAEGGKTEEKAAENGEEAKGSDAEATLRKELEEKNKELVDMKDKYLRSVADFRNLQERTRREVETARNFAIQKFGKDLVESVDNLERALEAVPAEKLAGDNQDLKDLHSGLKMTENVILNTLRRHGLERFDASELVEGKPQKFDPNRHEATFMAPSPGKEDGDILHAQTKGFLLNGRVLRAAKVGVVKNA